MLYNHRTILLFVAAVALLAAPLASALPKSAQHEVDSISPKSGPGVQENWVTIRGAGFSDEGMRVLFGEVEARVVLHDDSRTIRCPTPLGLQGQLPVKVIDPAGGTVEIAGGFGFLRNEVYGLSSSSGSTLGGEEVRIDLRFLPWPQLPLRVFFDGIEVPGLRLDGWGDYDDGYAYCITPPHAPGAVHVTVMHDDQVFEFPGEYRYVEPPANDNPEGAVSLGRDDTVSGDNAGAGTLLPALDCARAPLREVFYAIAPGASGLLSVSLCAEDVYSVAQVYDANLLPLQCGVTIDGCPTSAEEHTVHQFVVEACTPYYIVVGTPHAEQVGDVRNPHPDGGAFTLETHFIPDGNFNRAPENAEPESAQQLEDDAIVVGDFRCSTETVIAADDNGGMDLWYALQTSGAGQLALSACDIAGELYTTPSLRVYDEDLSLLTSAHGLLCGEVTSLDVDGAGEYLVEVEQHPQGNNRFRLNVNFTPETVEATEGGGDDGEQSAEGEATPDGESIEGDGGEEGAAAEGETLEGEPEAVEGEMSSEGEAGAEPQLPGIHNADLDADERIDLAEVLRVIQLRNAGTYHCAPGGEDGYAPGDGDKQSCARHTADYNPGDWAISLEEIVRLVQLFNAGGYTPCTGGEDGYCSKNS